MRRSAEASGRLVGANNPQPTDIKSRHVDDHRLVWLQQALHRLDRQRLRTGQHLISGKARLELGIDRGNGLTGGIKVFPKFLQTRR